MTGVLLSFTAMALSIRALGKTLGVFEILSIRNATGLVVLSALALARPQLRLQLTTRQIWLQATRNVLSFFGQFAWALGITLLPFATVFALEFTTPAWVALFAVLILGERMTASRIGVVVLGLAGILLIARPGLEGFQPAALWVLGSTWLTVTVPDGGEPSRRAPPWMVKTVTPSLSTCPSRAEVSWARPLGSSMCSHGPPAVVRKSARAGIGSGSQGSVQGDGR